MILPWGEILKLYRINQTRFMPSLYCYAYARYDTTVSEIITHLRLYRHAEIVIYVKFHEVCIYKSIRYCQSIE